MPVDDIFYKGTQVGQEITSSEDSTEFLENQNISTGRRLYMHSIMKRFLRTERQDFSRNGRIYSAIQPYAINLAPKYQNPSFTLYCTHEDNTIHARREVLQTWPEINPEVSVRQPQSTVENFFAFKPGAWEQFGQDFDPDSLEKYNHLAGGDEILPLYGDSDEENDYDPETWAEMEEELGTLEKPLRPLKRPLLSQDEVNEAIDEGIAELVVLWHTTQLPKKQRKALRLWKKTRSRDDRQSSLKGINDHLKRISTERIPRIRKEILDEVWTSQLQVRKQTRSMEQSIFDRENSLWEISVIENKSRPEKPPPKVLSKKTIVPSDNDEEGESLGSNSEISGSDDGLDDFIVDGSSDVEDEIELNLADSEAEEVEDITSPDATPTPTPSKNHSKIRLSRPIMSPPDPNSSDNDQTMTSEFDDISDAGPSNGKALVPQRSTSPDTSPSAFAIKNERSPIKLHVTPNNSTSNMIDLTMISSDDASPVIDLITPKKKGPILKLINRNSPFNSSPLNSPILISDGDELALPDVNNLPPLTQPAAIAKIPADTWIKLGDRVRLLIAMVFLMEPKRRLEIFFFVAAVTESQLWSNMDEVMEAILQKNETVKGVDADTFRTLIGFIKLFQVYAECQVRSLETPPRPGVIRKLRKLQDGMFPEFYPICRDLEGYFNGKSPKAQKLVENDDDYRDDEEPLSKSKRRRQINTSDDEDPDLDSPLKKRRKPIFEDAKARSLRDQDRQRAQLLEQRRKTLQSKLASSGYTGSQHEIIINDSKEDDQGFIYVDQNIARQIKPHQIEGVRFMWNQIVTDERDMQGCLLAHTMGLGKTMQVITLLSAIAESARSTDPTVYSQIPSSLRASKTLILCPPTLIDNWMDELLTWSPDEILGDFRKIDSSVKSLEQRLQTISDWFYNGGILVMGYDLFRIYIHNKKTKTRSPPLTEERHDEVMKHLLEGPNIIIADEAHKMKNAEAGITKAAVQFKSRSRIALTGSPLANNVEEYHTMIDWVTPNYLGPAKEFREKYVYPIQQGLWHDSDAKERRLALKMLGVLKADVAPKVHRADTSVLRKDLPKKKEFVITVPLTDLQREAYIIYVREIIERGSYATTKDGEVAQSTIWHWLAILSLLCNHPDCFNKKLNERKDEAWKGVGSTLPIASRDNTDQEEAIAADLNEPIWKVGVSKGLVKAVSKLFESEPNLKAIELSNKVKILCQILEGSKAVGDKVLVFSQSLPTLDFLENMLIDQKRKYSRLDGSTKMSSRQASTKEFNTGDIDIYLISTAAGGLGLNLPGANRVVIFDFKFNPIMEEQAVGRAYRIGQMKPVFVYRFVVGGTFETNVHNKTIFKMQLASRVVDKKSPIARASKRLSEFLFEPKQVEQSDLSEFKGRDPSVLDKILAAQSKDSTIRAIVQSDNFERDDEDKLSPEEQKEVDSLISDKQLARSDPVAYRALMEKRNAIQYAQQRALPLPNPLTPVVNGLASGVQTLSVPQNQAALHSSTSVGQTTTNNVTRIFPPQPTHRVAGHNGVHTAIMPPNSTTQSGSSNSPLIAVNHSAAAVSTPARGRSSNTGEYPVARTSTPEGRSTSHQDPRPRSRSVTPPAKDSLAKRMSPVGATPPRLPFSRQLFNLIGAALEAIATTDSSNQTFAKNPGAIAQRISADITEILDTSTRDKESRSRAHGAIVAALQANPAKCRALAEAKSETRAFVRSFIDSPTESNLASPSDSEGIEKTEMFMTMSRPPPSRKPQPIRSLREPVIQPRNKSSIPLDQARYMHRNNEKGASKSRSPLNKPSAIPVSTPPSTRIPEWAETEIQEARRLSHSRSDSRSTPSLKD